MDYAASACSDVVTPAVPIPVHSRAAAVRTEMNLFFFVMEFPLSKNKRSHGSFEPTSAWFHFLLIIARVVIFFKNEITSAEIFVHSIWLREQFCDIMHKVLKNAQITSVMFGENIK